MAIEDEFRFWSLSDAATRPATAGLDCRRIFLILSGADKRAVYEAPKTPGPVSELPVRLLIHQDNVPVTVYVAD